MGHEVENALPCVSYAPGEAERQHSLVQEGKGGDALLWPISATRNRAEKMTGMCRSPK